MSKDLTEQWKNGELEQGYYYTKYTPSVGKPFVEIELRNYLIDLAKVRDANTVEVLAPVPSYEEWMRTNYNLDDYKRLSNMRGEVISKMEESNEDTVKYLREENLQLKQKVTSRNKRLQKYKKRINEIANLASNRNILIKQLKKENDFLDAECKKWSMQETERTMECVKLKELLKECREEMNEYDYYTEFNEVGRNKLLTKIDEVLK